MSNSNILPKLSDSRDWQELRGPCQGIAQHHSEGTFFLFETYDKLCRIWGQSRDPEGHCRSS
jgi:hypothetical protein